MSKLLYLEDSYLKECDATITSVKDNKYVILDQTIFYPKGGGQPSDIGKLIRDGEEFNIIYVGKFSGEVSHEIDRTGLEPGDKVRCYLDWDRRYRLMRSHTAAHVLTTIVTKRVGALITGNQLDLDQTRFDFNLENFDREIFLSCISTANQLFKQDIPVKWYELPKDEAMRIPGIIKLANALPPDIPTLRIVEIAGLDQQADGGTHVRNLNEIGQIEFIKAENKGKNNRRLYYRLSK